MVSKYHTKDGLLLIAEKATEPPSRSGISGVPLRRRKPGALHSLHHEIYSPNEFYVWFAKNGPKEIMEENRNLLKFSQQKNGRVFLLNYLN
jgi:hypothetical protein